MAGSLILVPSLLGVVPPDAVLPARTIEIARTLTHWVVETPKAARAFLQAIGVGRPISELSIVAFPKVTDIKVIDVALGMLRAGNDVGVLSDAGCPGIADPGEALVAAAHSAGVRVIPLVGPSALLLALMASGMNGQQFAFHGYLPVKPDARAAAVRKLEQSSRSRARTEMFIETPYRNAAMLATLVATLDAGTRVCVAADLTLPSETVESRTVDRWRKIDAAQFNRRPAMFLLQA
jgi:16S rRNA (cytidine1402-2'-O)-methyltransferase